MCHECNVFGGTNQVRKLSKKLVYEMTCHGNGWRSNVIFGTTCDSESPSPIKIYVVTQLWDRSLQARELLENSGNVYVERW